MLRKKGMITFIMNGADLGKKKKKQILNCLHIGSHYLIKSVQSKQKMRAKRCQVCFSIYF